MVQFGKGFVFTQVINAICGNTYTKLSNINRMSYLINEVESNLFEMLLLQPMYFSLYMDGDACNLSEPVKLHI